MFFRKLESQSYSNNKVGSLYARTPSIIQMRSLLWIYKLQFQAQYSHISNAPQMSICTSVAYSKQHSHSQLIKALRWSDWGEQGGGGEETTNYE